MLRLIIKSLVELFSKFFSTLLDKRSQRVGAKKTSHALAEAHISTGNAEIKNLINANSPKSGFYLLEKNLDAFISRRHLINNAEVTLDLQYYYFHGDTSGHLIAKSLVEAANRGVRVRLLLDDIDTLGADEPISLLNSHPEIEIRIFNPFYFRGLLRYFEIINISRVGRRMHNKAIIADNSQAIIGGRNIGDIYFSADPETLFLDIDLLSVGPIVSHISKSFDEYWNSRWAIPVDDLYARPNKTYAQGRIKSFIKRHLQDVRVADFSQALVSSDLHSANSVSELPLIWSEAQLFYDAPSKIDESVESASRELKTDLHNVVNSATESITIISPYFIPGEQGVEWFRNIIKKGITVNVFTNSLAATDVIAVHSGYINYRYDLLDAGVNLYELKPSAYARERKKFKLLQPGSRTSLHAKTIIVDHHKVFIGSPNLDPRSRELNTEIGLLVDNAKLADQVKEMFAGITQKRNSYHITLENNGDGKKKLVWVSEEKGKPITVYSEPDVGFWRKLSLQLLRLVPMEEFL